VEIPLALTKASPRELSRPRCPAARIITPLALIRGTRLGPYEVTAQIGVGGMGEVYRATDINLKRAVAIKVLPASVAADLERPARFQLPGPGAGPAWKWKYPANTNTGRFRESRGSRTGL